MREVAETFLLIVSIYTLVNLATARFVVEGSSMQPNFESDQFVIVSRLTYLLGAPQRGDVIVFHYPEEPDRDFIKRVIGLAGETVTINQGQVYVNNQPLDEPYVRELCRGSACNGAWTLAADEYFVLGDNRNNSRDSHNFGPLKREYIIGQAWLRYWPPKDWGLIPHHDYEPLALPTLGPATPIPSGDPLSVLTN